MLTVVPASPATADDTTFRFADWIRFHADKIRTEDTPAAEWLAAKIDELAAQADVLLCDSPGDFEDREEALRKLYHGQ